VGVAGGFFRHTNPGQLIAERIGAPNAATMLTAKSGTSGQDLVGLAAERIANGQLDVALVLGGEARWSFKRLKRDGLEPGWITDLGEGTPETMSGFPEDMMMSDFRWLTAAVVGYALFEDSLRASRGTPVAEHRDQISALWAGFSEVASGNPYAWDRTAHSAESIRDASPSNRMISFPCTKAMVANNTVDMASAILLCSEEVARSAGIHADRRVYPHVVTYSHETWRVRERGQLHGCPALTTAGLAAFEHAGIAPDDVDHVDLYACFPSVVQMSSEALGLQPGRPLTVTGGLGFAGAGIANAAGHSIAAMVDRVRGGGIGLVHANGGYATKHAFAVYSAEPPTAFARIDVQAAVEHRARVGMEDDWIGPVTIEAATVVYGREGPDHALAAVLSAEGVRGYATTSDLDAITLTESTGIAGRVATRVANAGLLL
jgi:acetyl-CoA C-acetyltransferase